MTTWELGSGGSTVFASSRIIAAILNTFMGSGGKKKFLALENVNLTPCLLQRLKGSLRRSSIFFGSKGERWHFQLVPSI